MFKALVVNPTDERMEPTIFGTKTGTRLPEGLTWLTELYLETAPGISWIGTPSGFWTAATYPINNDPDNIKIYVQVTVIPDSPVTYDPTDKLIHEVGGIVIGEYHRKISP